MKLKMWGIKIKTTFRSTNEMHVHLINFNGLFKDAYKSYNNSFTGSYKNFRPRYASLKKELQQYLIIYSEITDSLLVYTRKINSLSCLVQKLICPIM